MDYSTNNYFILLLQKKGFQKATARKKKRFAIKVPHFIFLFLLASILDYAFGKYIPAQTVFHGLTNISKRILSATLFLIGAGLTIESIKHIGVKPLLIATILWIFITSVSLLVILPTID